MAMVPLILMWSGLGLVGSFIMYEKAAVKERAIWIVLFSLPHAVIFGPIFLFINLSTQSTKQCPHCKSDIPRDASVCAKCTRDVN